MVLKWSTPPSRFVTDSISLMGGQVIIAIFSLGSVVITARALDADGRGQFSLALLLANMIFMFSELNKKQFNGVLLRPKKIPLQASSGPLSQTMVLGSGRSSSLYSHFSASKTPLPIISQWAQLSPTTSPLCDRTRRHN